MTDWTKLAEPFPDTEVKQRPGAAKWEHKQSCEGARCRDTKNPEAHHQFSYVDARAVAQRLDEVLTPEGWNFTATVVPGTDIVKGRLEIGSNVREDHGYPNSERDEEPLKAATSDALKRCAVLFGVGRHLYEDNAAPRTTARAPRQRPAAAPAPQRAPVAAPRPHLVDTDLMEPDDVDLDELQASPAARGDLKTCPIHDTAWLGSPGDLWHKDSFGAYCRHPDNVKKARAR